ncbi:MAG TPA: iron-containing alcohol dehydrogenase, partial [Bacteroidales bacterium]|nr:iron-containing alcohol dehydrogenase [Bacteroidales bacterium]
MNNFVFQNPTKLIFGKGTIEHLSTEIPANKKVFVTFGGGSVKTNGVYQQVKRALTGKDHIEFWGIEPNPTVETLRKAIAIVKEENCDFILAVGGGSVIDGSKLIAAAAMIEEDAWELVKRPSLYKGSLPLASVLTIPATGSEMNPGAVITNSALKEKFSFYSTFPVFSILDPQVAFSLPKYQIACGLTDTFVHVLEQYLTTTNQSPLMDRWSEGILQTIIEVAPKVYGDKPTYDDMATFMLSATMALNGFISMGVSQDWSTHMIGHELSALHNLTHGHTLAIVLKGTMWVMKEEKGDKIVQMGKRVWNIEESDREKIIEKTIDKCDAFFRSLGLKTRLSENGIGKETIDEIVRRFEKRNVHFGENKTID